MPVNIKKGPLVCPPPQMKAEEEEGKLIYPDLERRRRGDRAKRKNRPSSFHLDPRAPLSSSPPPAHTVIWNCFCRPPLPPSLRPSGGL